MEAHVFEVRAEPLLPLRVPSAGATELGLFAGFALWGAACRRFFSCTRGRPTGPCGGRLVYGGAMGVPPVSSAFMRSTSARIIGGCSLMGAVLT